MNANILDYGAVSGAEKVCTLAIQNAIDACAASGGGRVTIPAGSFVTGTIWLRSHVELHLEHGAKLIASKERADYNAEDAYMQNYGWAPEEWVGQHLILAIEEDDVAITGTGIIDGSGDFFFEETRIYGTAYWMHGVSLAKDKEKLRPGQLICFVECTNVTVKDVTIQNTPCWACFFHGCEVVTVYGVKIFNPSHFCNTDGIDIDSCKYVTVSDCIVNTGDDAIAIRCAAHRLRNKERRTEYITITNCFLSTCACAIRVGVGKGYIKHVRVSNLTVAEAGALFCLMSGYLGSGAVEIEDVHIRDVSATNVSLPFEVQDGAQVGIRDVSFKDIRVETRFGSHIVTEKAGSISGLEFENINVKVKKANIPVATVESKREEKSVLTFDGVNDLFMERVRVSVDEAAQEEWHKDVEILNCENVETYYCKYKENCVGGMNNEV